MPRVSGGARALEEQNAALRTSAPRVRGWTRCAERRESLSWEYPACAGVDGFFYIPKVYIKIVPRVRGDDRYLS